VRYGSREEVPYRPFCSRRCKLIDLAHWLNEDYRISEDRIDADLRLEGSDEEGAVADP